MSRKIDITQSDLLIIALLGYPTLAIWGEATSVGQNFIFRSLFHVLFIFVLVFCLITTHKTSNTTKDSYVIKLVSSIFVLRLAYNGIILQETPYQDFQMPVAVVEIMITMLCFSNGQEVRFRVYDKLVFLFVITLLLAVIKSAEFSIVAEENFSGRASIGRLDPISLAMYSITCIIFASSTLMNLPKRFSLLSVAAVLTVLQSLYLVIVSGSRGPFLFLIFAMFFIFYRLYVKFGTKVTVSIICFLSIIFIVVLIVASGNGFLFAIDRAGNSVSEGDLRTQFVSNGIELIKESPIIGSGIFVPEVLYLGEKFYSHVLLVDVFLHFGIPVGTLVLVTFIMSTYGLCKRCIKATEGEFALCLASASSLLLCLTSSQLIWSPTVQCFYFFGLYSYFDSRL